MSVIDKKYREKCWLARDDYWKCLDLNKEDKEKCLKIRQLFESSCPATWVTHFDQKHEYDIFKRQLALGQVETDKLKTIKQKPKA
jgi:cytochrome c oxidase assembly factor 6